MNTPNSQPPPDLASPEDSSAHGVSVLRERIAWLEQQVVERREIENRLRSVLQELRVHQEELRIQNESLLEIQAALELSREKYRDLFEQAPVGYLSLDQQGVIREINLTGAEMLARSQQQLMNKPLVSYLISTHHLAFFQHLKQVFAGQNAQLELRIRLPAGQTFWAQLESRPLHETRNKIQFCRSALLNISQRMQAEQDLRLAYKIIENAMEGVLVTERGGRIIMVNPGFEHISGYRADEVVGRNPSILSSGRHEPEFYRAIWESLARNGHWQGQIWNRRKSGEVYPEWLNITAIRDEQGQVSHYVGIFSDISMLEENRQKLHYLAYYDSLTDLPNRHLFHDRLQQAVTLARRYHTLVGLMFLDLDRFKLINDVLGHGIGDLLLQQVAARLTDCVRESDTVTRMGGDEFTVLLPNIISMDDLLQTAERILGIFRQPFELEGRRYYISTSIGISHYPGDGEDAETLLKNADAAMYRAKEHGRNTYYVFHRELYQKDTERLELETALRQSQEGENFTLYYQPQVELASGKILALETLLRWDAPQQGPVAPTKFIPIAEETGLIVPIGYWSLRHACRQARAWQQQFVRDLRVAINLSPHQFLQPDMPEQIQAILRETDLSPESLELELTEKATMPNLDYSTRTLRQLRDMGVGIVMDDFGIGYSSLEQLRHLPINKLKIDESLVRDIITDPDDAAIVAAIIHMARSLRLTVVAEGVENPEQLAFLRENHCDAMQGKLFAMPGDRGEIQKILQAPPVFWPGET